MLESLNKLMLAALGAVEMTREAAEQTFDELVRRGQLSREGKTAFVQDLMDSADATRREMRSFIDRRVQEAVDRLNLASKDDLRRLEAKLDELLVEKRNSEVDTTMI